MTNFNRLVEYARILKLDHQTGRCFHVSFALRGKNVVEIGINNYIKNNQVGRLYKTTKSNNIDFYQAGIHSEIALTGKLKHSDVSSLTLVNIRIDNNGKVAFSMPCPNCAWVLRDIGFKKLYYSENNGTFSKFPTMS